VSALAHPNGIRIDTTTLFQVRMVLAMSQWGIVSISARSPPRIRSQISEENTGGRRKGKHDQPGRVLRSGGASGRMMRSLSSTMIIVSFLVCVQRHKLGPNLTPVTRETFAKWKQTRMSKKEAEADAHRKAKDAQASAGKNSGMSGRDLFQYNPEWFQDSDEEEEDWDLSKYRRQKEDEDLAAENERIRLLSIHGGDP
jgi:DRG Family Regulatory Proteins, Tma46